MFNSDSGCAMGRRGKESKPVAVKARKKAPEGVALPTAQITKDAVVSATERAAIAQPAHAPGSPQGVLPRESPRRRKPLQQRSRQMVDTLIEAAFICVGRYGLANTSTRHIADVAGVSPGTLYQYFSDKDAVFTDMQRRLAQDVVALLRGAIPELVTHDVRGGVRMILYRFCDLLRANDGRYLTFVMQGAHLDAREHMPRIESALLELAAQYAMHNPGVLRLQNIPVVMYVVINGGVGTLLCYLSEPSPSLTLEQLVEGIANMVAAYTASEMAPAIDRRHS